MDEETEYGPPRVSEELNPQNLVELFSMEDAQMDKDAKEEEIQKEGTKIHPDNGGRLRVFVRIRPQAGVEDAALSGAHGQQCMYASSDCTLVMAPPEDSLAYKNGDRGQTFTCSRVFGPQTSQCEYYSATTEPLVDDLLNVPAYDGVVMAYGITAAGKTYTIEGKKNDPGIMPRAMESLFEKIEHRKDADYIKVTVSYCEIYNDSIYDLLVEQPASAKRKSLKLMETQGGRVQVMGLSSVPVSNAFDALIAIRKGSKQRQKGETGLNYSSSRSHSIFIVNVSRIIEHLEDGDKEAAFKEEELGRLSFADLAGSERLHRTGNVGIRLKESVAINASLMTLGRCLEALRYNQQQDQISRRTGVPPTLKIVPYRESKVTHLFRDALHGYGSVILSVNVSMDTDDMNETARVLKYAAMASQINTVQLSEMPKKKVHASTPRALRKHKELAEGKGKKRRWKHKEKNLKKEKIKKKTIKIQRGEDGNEERAVTYSQPETGAVDNEDEDAVVYNVALGIDETEYSEQVEYQQDSNSADAVEDITLVGMNDTNRVQSNEPSTHQEINQFDVKNQGRISEVASCMVTPIIGGNDDIKTETDHESLKNEVNRLLSELQAAEEKLIILEGEVREEVASEMSALLQDMEKSFKKRLKDETSMVEKRLELERRSQYQEIEELRKKLKEEEQARLVIESQREMHKEETELLSQKIAYVEKEISTTQEALNETLEELEKVHMELTNEKEASAALAHALSEALRQSSGTQSLGKENQENDVVKDMKGIYETRLQQQITQLEANKAMEMEMSEHLIDRLKKDNMALKRKLAAATSAIESIATPSRNKVMQRMLASCPAGIGRGAQGTPHEVALARARKAAMEEERSYEVPSSFKISRFAREIEQVEIPETQRAQKPFDKSADKTSSFEKKEDSIPDIENSQAIAHLDTREEETPKEHDSKSSKKKKTRKRKVEQKLESKVLASNTRITRRMAKKMELTKMDDQEQDKNNSDDQLRIQKESTPTEEKTQSRKRRLLSTKKTISKEGSSIRGEGHPVILGVSRNKRAPNHPNPQNQFSNPVSLID